MKRVIAVIAAVTLILLSVESYASFTDRLFGTGNYGEDLYGVGVFIEDNVTAERREVIYVDAFQPIIRYYIIPIIALLAFILIFVFRRE